MQHVTDVKERLVVLHRWRGTRSHLPSVIDHITFALNVKNLMPVHNHYQITNGDVMDLKVTFAIYVKELFQPIEH